MRTLLFFSIVALAGCIPAEFKPLDYAPGPGARETYALTNDLELRYNGHSVHDEIGKQTAGDLEARTRTFAPAEEGAPRVELVTVSPLGTDDYYKAVRRVLEAAKPDVVLFTFAVKGDESDPRHGGRRARKGEEADVENLRRIVGMFPGLTFPRDADGLAWDERFVPPQLSDADIAFVDSVTKDEPVPTDEQLDDLKKAIGYVGADVIIHNLIFELVGVNAETGEMRLHAWRTERMPENAPPLAEPPPTTETFEQGVARAEKIENPEQRRAALLAAWSEHRLSEATLEAMDLSTAAGAKRFVILALHDTAGGISQRLRARGYKVERERWLPAIPLLSDPERRWQLKSD